jgi:UDP:flavonoid glycosyltransferase YjiC (YdhE family)
MECIHHAVPMLVYPLNSRWDQAGNAGRVVYHGVGLQGNINRDSKDRIAYKIDAILRNQEMGRKVKQLQGAFQQENKSDWVVSFLESLLKEQKPMKVPL